MQQLILIVHVLASLGLIALVLMQYGKGADVGAAFGSGASNTMFGSVGAVPFLTKITGLLAAVFFVTSLSLGFLASQEVKSNSQLMSLPTQNKPVQPK
jgi:preprotein translocase subunit SecG